MWLEKWWDFWIKTNTAWKVFDIIYRESFVWKIFSIINWKDMDPSNLQEQLASARIEYQQNI